MVFIVIPLYSPYTLERNVVSPGPTNNSVQDYIKYNIHSIVKWTANTQNDKFDVSRVRHVLIIFGYCVNDGQKNDFHVQYF